MERMQHLPRDLGDEIARQLATHQGERTDAEMARLLGCSRPHWHHLKMGRRRPSYALVQRAVKLFPDLYPVVMRDLMSGDTPTEAAS